MNEEPKQTSPEAAGVQNENSVPNADAQSPQSQNITLAADDLRNIIQSTVESVLNASRTSEYRKQAEEYNTRIAEAVQSSQANLMKPEDNSKYDLKYIERVFEEDNIKRKQHPEGKALYSDKGEDFIKAKIIVLKKIGLTNEEIAKELKDLSV